MTPLPISRTPTVRTKVLDAEDDAVAAVAEERGRATNNARALPGETVLTH
jgi:hypothetical protein